MAKPASKEQDPMKKRALAAALAAASFGEQGPEATIPGEVVRIWVKSGNNQGSDPRLGELFEPDYGVNCFGGGGGSL
jgi:hypothetical protein